jgi:hypothetical protein
MFKSFMTSRTGNDWVHALGYHAVAPRDYRRGVKWFSGSAEQVELAEGASETQ